MPDMNCPKCNEPWDTAHVRNDAFGGDEYDGRENMPPALGSLWDEWVATANEHGWDSEEADAKRDVLLLAYYNTGLAHGCEACWYEPDRVLDGDARLEAMERALFDSAWDGDPAEILGAW